VFFESFNCAAQSAFLFFGNNACFRDAPQYVRLLRFKKYQITFDK
jgi:hypothetical protein